MAHTARCPVGPDATCRTSSAFAKARPGTKPVTARSQSDKRSSFSPPAKTAVVAPSMSPCSVAVRTSRAQACGSATSARDGAAVLGSDSVGTLWRSVASVIAGSILHRRQGAGPNRACSAVTAWRGEVATIARLPTYAGGGGAPPWDARHRPHAAHKRSVKSQNLNQFPKRLVEGSTPPSRAR